MIRIYILLAIIALIIGLIVTPRIKKLPDEALKKQVNKTVTVLGLILIITLAITGKLPAVFTAIGVSIAILLRYAALFVNYAPQLRRIWQYFQSGQTRQQSSSEQRNNGNSSNNSKGQISRAEALQILGLKSGANKAEIIAAHRKLISRLHPDKGGSDYLAAQINLAKKVLLNS